MHGDSRRMVELLSVPRCQLPTSNSQLPTPNVRISQDLLRIGSWRMGVRVSRKLKMINPARDAGRAEPVVDVDDADAAGAAIEHPEQRRDAVEAGAVSDAGG